MKPRSKKIFSVILALLFGAGIILFAWKSDMLTRTNTLNEKTGNAWKDSLQVIPQEFSSKILKTQANDTHGETATTTTDRLAREVLANYALIQSTAATTTVSDAEAQVLAEALVGNIEVPRGTQYALANLTLINDNSNAALVAYSIKVSDRMQTFAAARAKNELSILTDALIAKDGKKLQELAPIAQEYEVLTKDLLAITTPSSIASLHLRLAQSYANIGATIIAMQKMFVDPVQGLVALTQYKKEIVALQALAKEYKDYVPAY
ncbi:MAG: hypothetical protein ACYCZ7_02540 [Minisyncoccota bacterium]